MTGQTVGQQASRGTSISLMREAVCKDCLREVEIGKRAADDVQFTYNEVAALSQLDRGLTRSDRCREHRQEHRGNIQGMAVAYIDLKTVGEVSDRENPAGPLGGLGPLPEAHELVSGSVDLGQFGFGMDESHVSAVLQYLSDEKTRVLIVKAGTGTGKSTYMPYRLMDPPEDAPFRPSDNGQIIVTEPRVQATTNVAGFVGSVMSGAGGVGPGYPVGYQVAGDRNHDEACQLVYVTDGTMINWLREGRLSQIGMVIVDEAHERSTNIDFILGYLKREIDRYPHLRVIVTSATFNEEFYHEYFGGADRANVVVVPAVKSIGYGFPLFSSLDSAVEGEVDLEGSWPIVGLALNALEGGDDAFISRHWPTRFAPPLKEEEVAANSRESVGWEEDLHETTQVLLPLRYQGPELPVAQWKDRMPRVLGDYVVSLASALDETEIFGDILAFLPTAKAIEEACEIIRGGLGDAADVFALLASLPTDQKALALAARQKGDKRKIVVSTNLAETSLTVEGVRFVVDSGLIAQSEWDPARAQGGIPTRPHSQSGVMQRWGRVGRKAPGWVFPLYTKAQFLALPEDTPPGSTRDNLEQLVMTAKLGGIDDVVSFPWPAAFEPTTVELDITAQEAQEVFKLELLRANEALKRGGALDPDGDPTGFGKELARFQGLGSPSSAIAIMYADRLACVPEVSTILALLDGVSLIGANGLLLDAFDWPDEWRFEAAERHRALASACEDDAELVLQIMAAWERSDEELPPWMPSATREAWARQWWISNDRLLQVADLRRDVLASLSPAMKEEVKRFVEPGLVRRARGAISRAMASLVYELQPDDSYSPASPFGASDEIVGWLDLAVPRPELLHSIIPLVRKAEGPDVQVLSNIVRFEPWAVDPREPTTTPTGLQDAVRLLALSAEHGKPDTSRDYLGALHLAWPAGMRAQLSFLSLEGEAAINEVLAVIDPSPMPPGEDITEEEREIEETLDDDDPATIEDASPEIDTTWPKPNAPQEDPDLTLRRSVLDVEGIERASQACGVCDACLLGNEAECDDPILPPTGEAAIDTLAAWRNRASRSIDTSQPTVEFEAGASVEHAWYEVCGYRMDNETISVVLRPDWRPSDLFAGPAQHPDLEEGQHVEVIVGPTVQDHRGPIRVLMRADGRGRFLVREAQQKVEKQEEQRQLAISLARQYRGLLDHLVEGASLTGVVIPRKQSGTLTITFLNLLHGHFTVSHRTSGKRLEAEGRDGRSSQAMFYPATVLNEPNHARYIDVALLARDSEVGIVHVVPVYVGSSEGDGVRDDAPTVGAAVLVRLGWEPAKLRLTGMPLDEVRAIVRDGENLLLPESDTRTSATVDQPESELGGFKTVLISRGTVLRASVERLAALDPSPQWQSDVWLFWARSRHLRTDRNDGFRPGDSVDPVESRAEVQAEGPRARRLGLDEAKLLYPEGMSVQGEVTRVRDDLGRAWLVLEGGGAATTSSDRIGANGVLQISSYLAEGDNVDGTVTKVSERNGAAQVHIDLRDVEVATLQEQLAELGIIVGAQLQGRANNMVDNLGLFVDSFVEAAPKIGGLVHVSTVPVDALHSISKGDWIDVVITGVRPHRRREGDVEISLRLG